MDEQYMKRAKNYLVSAKSELRNILNSLDDCINVNNNSYKENELKEINEEINVQINNLTYYIIPSFEEE